MYNLTKELEMIIDQKRKEELKKEGFTQGAEEIKEKNIEKGNKDGRIEALRDMLVESIENQFGDIEKKVRKKIRYIKNILFLKNMIQLSYETKNIEEINTSIHNYLSDEDMYRREGYEHAINSTGGFYQTGRYKGLIDEKLSMILSIFQKRFGHLELEIKAAIITRDLKERIDELFLMTFKIYDKKELIRYIKKSMTGANVIRADAYIELHKAFMLNDLINALFETQDDSILKKIRKIRDVDEIEALIEQAKHSKCLEEFIEKLDQAFERAVNRKQELSLVIKFSLDHLLQE